CASLMVFVKPVLPRRDTYKQTRDNRVVRLLACLFACCTVHLFPSLTQWRLVRSAQCGRPARPNGQRLWPLQGGAGPERSDVTPRARAPTHAHTAACTHSVRKG